MGFHEPGEIRAASSYGAKRAGGNKRGFELWSQKSRGNKGGFRLRAISRTWGTGEISAAFLLGDFSHPWGTGEISATFVEAGEISGGFQGEISATCAWLVWLRPRHTGSYNNSTFPYPLLYPFYPQN